MAPSIERSRTLSATSSDSPWTATVEPDGSSPWKPAMPVWRLWLLIVLSMGLYRLFWVVGMARELRRHQDSDIRPWLYFIGMLVGIASPVVASGLTGHIDRNGHRRGLDFDPPRMAIVLLAVVAPLVGFGTLRFPEAELWQLAVAFLGVYTVIEPLPWLLIQLRMNRLKSAMVYPEKPVRRFRFSTAEFTAMIVAVVAWPLIIAGSLPDAVLDEIFDMPPDGKAIVANTPTAGETPGYRLTVGSDDWMRVENGTIAEDADLELIGPSPDTWIIVYTLRGDWTMDEIVDFRRNEIKGQVEYLSSHERRTMLADSAVPVSHARYTGNLRDGGWRATWWVSTVVVDSGAYEVLGSTMSGGASQREIEQIAKSLRLELESP